VNVFHRKAAGGVRLYAHPIHRDRHDNETPERFRSCAPARRARIRDGAVPQGLGTQDLIPAVRDMEQTLKFSGNSPVNTRPCTTRIHLDPCVRGTGGEVPGGAKNAARVVICGMGVCPALQIRGRPNDTDAEVQWLPLS
jgi:hypothetical protein